MPHGDPIQGLAKFFYQLIKGELRRPPRFGHESLDLPPAFGLPQPFLFEYHKLYRVYQRARRALTKTKVIPNYNYEKDVIAVEQIRHRSERWREVVATGAER